MRQNGSEAIFPQKEKFHFQHLERFVYSRKNKAEERCHIGCCGFRNKLEIVTLLIIVGGRWDHKLHAVFSLAHRRQNAYTAAREN